MFNVLKLLLVFVLLVLIYPKRVYAYLDPGSGSYLLQILIAGVLGAGVTTRLYWRKIKSLFSQKKKDGKQDKKKEDKEFLS